MGRPALLLVMLAVGGAAFFALPDLPVVGQRSPKGTAPVETAVVGDFLVQTRDGYLVLFGVGLRVTHAQNTALAGTLAARVRAVVKRAVAGARVGELRHGLPRLRFEVRLRDRVTRATGLHASRLFFTDMAVR